MLVGYNISGEISDDKLIKAVHDGCNFIQIFTNDPTKLNYNKNTLNMNIIKKWKGGLVIHGNFLINLCRPPDDKIAKNSIYLLKKDLEISKKLNALGVIIHMGKDTTKLGYQKAMDTYVKNLNTVISESTGTIILETGAGVGTEVATRLNELGKLREGVTNKERIKFCIDTCHIFSAGYDLTNETVVESLEYYIENTLGWNNVAVLHCNDSKHCLCSKKDYHADITDGYISKKNLLAFMKFINFFIERNIPIILETPEDNVEIKTQVQFMQFIKFTDLNIFSNYIKHTI
jgi:deoxyribonuclease-4